MVFGSHSTNPTHWKKLVKDKKDQKAHRESFRKAVLMETGFSDAQWDKYWKEIVDFRNKYSAHKDNFQGPIPFDKALKVAYAYDRWIRKLFPGIWEEPSLEESATDAKRSMKPLIKTLFLQRSRKPFGEKGAPV